MESEGAHALDGVDAEAGRRTRDPGGIPAVTLVESPTERGAGAGRLISRLLEWAHVVRDGGGAAGFASVTQPD